jgi:DNA-binding MurR/RpiR family transcriptional regulator
MSVSVSERCSPVSCEPDRVKGPNDAGVPSAVLRIRSVYAALGEAEQRVADFVCTHQKEMIYLPITELAEKTLTSESTVVRMCQKAGFKGYQDLKLTLAQDIVSPLQSIHEEVTLSDDIQTVMSKVFQSIVQTLQYTRDVIDFQELERAAEVLMDARRVAVFGLGNSSSVAMDLSHKFMRLGFSATAYTDSHLQAIAASFLTTGDVALGVSHSGSSRDVVEALAIAREGGATTVCITNYGKSPITKVADIKLFTASEETKYRVLALSSRIAQLGIVDSLYTYLALRRGQKAVDGMKRLERALTARKY